MLNNWHKDMGIFFTQSSIFRNKLVNFLCCFLQIPWWFFHILIHDYPWGCLKSQNSLPQRLTKDFHKEHKGLITALSLCVYFVLFVVKKIFETDPSP